MKYLLLLLLTSCHGKDYWKRDCVWNSGIQCGDYRLVPVDKPSTR